MKRSQIIFMILSIFAGGLLLVSFFTNIPTLDAAATELLLWAERVSAVLLFFALLDAVILQVRGTGTGSGMRVIRVVGFIVFILVLFIGLTEETGSGKTANLVYIIQKSMEAALAGLVCVSLIFALYRLPSRPPSAGRSAYVVGLFLFLVIYGGLSRYVKLPATVSRIIDWLRCIPRGALTGLFIGAAIGAAVTGLRLILSGNKSAKEDR